jgi:hypothetical protein
LLTYAVFPFGVITIMLGSGPTLIGVPTVLVAVLIGVTQPAKWKVLTLVT